MKKFLYFVTLVAMVQGLNAAPREMDAGVSSYSQENQNQFYHSETTMADTQRAHAGQLSTVDIISKDPELSTLSQALIASGLMDKLQGGTFTIFAPTNEAFAKLPKGKLDELLKPENKEQLKSILSYHITPGSILTKDMKNESLTTLNGKNLTLLVGTKKIQVNNANLVQPDVHTSNGIVHIVDVVLIP